MLALGFLSAGDGGREKQRRPDPGKADPDNRRLDMHIAQEVEGQEVVDGDAVEARPVVIGMRHDDAGRDLHQQQRRDHEKVFSDSLLAGRQGLELRQGRVHRRIIGIVQVELINEDNQPEGKEGEAEAHPGPTEGVGGGRVADQWFIGPVLGPGPGRPGRRATVVSEEKTRKSAVWRASAGVRL